MGSVCRRLTLCPSVCRLLDVRKYVLNLSPEYLYLSSDIIYALFDEDKRWTVLGDIAVLMKIVLQVLRIGEYILSFSGIASGIRREPYYPKQYGIHGLLYSG